MCVCGGLCVVTDRLMPGQRGALWLHLMHYCKSCTSPKMPEYLLYAYHSEYGHLLWRDLLPDQALMSQFFNVRGLCFVSIFSTSSSLIRPFQITALLKFWSLELSFYLDG